jgi:hypothetical protein
MHLARPLDWRTIGRLCNVSESTAHSIYRRFGRRFRTAFDGVVRWPTHDEQLQSAGDLQRRWGIHLRYQQQQQQQNAH